MTSVYITLLIQVKRQSSSMSDWPKIPEKKKRENL
jgi:hypothetical protein